VEIVGHAWFPGTSQDRPGLLVSARALAAATAARHVTNPGAGAYGYLWARGPAVRILPAVDASSLRPVYLTTPRHIREDGSVAASERSYRYVRTIGVVLGVLALVALLLYLQARQRSQRIASSLARRMGLGAAADAAAVALEAATIAAVAVVTGAASAIALARPVVTHVDPLPGLAPSSTLVVPWTAIAVAGAATVVAAALLGAAAVALAARSDVAEAIRVG
jgi:putative ABC transport system permease protein